MSKSLLLALTTAVLLAITLPVRAQEAKNGAKNGNAPAAEAAPPQGRRDARGGADAVDGDRRRGRWFGGMRGSMGGVAIFVTNDFVYVVRGNVLYQFTSVDLEPVNRIELETGMRPVRPEPKPEQRPQQPKQ